jgi:hypothetical protein
MHRTIRKQLEGRLSADALEYLNEEFRKAEEVMLKIKELEKKEELLLDQLIRKDEMIRSLFEKSKQEQSSGRQQIGYQSQGFSPSYFQNPEEEYERQSMMPSFEMRRGSPGSEMRRGGGGSRSLFEMRRGGGSRSEMEMARGGRGGSGGGSRSEAYFEAAGGGGGSSSGGSGSSSGGGTSSHYTPYPMPYFEEEAGEGMEEMEARRGRKSGS